MLGPDAYIELDNIVLDRFYCMLESHECCIQSVVLRWHL